MANITVGADTTWPAVQACLDKAKPYVVGYKKHIQTARSLFLVMQYYVCTYTHMYHIDI